MKKKIWIAAGIIILIIALIGFNFWKKLAEDNISVEVTTLQQEEIVETVMTPGQLKLADQQFVYNSGIGEIDEILVKEGDSVKEGAPLLQYKSKQLELEKEQNELQLQSSYLQLNNIKKQHQEIDKKLEDEQDNEALKDQLQSEHDQIELQQQQANIDIKQLQLQKETIDEQIAELKIKSEISGVVLEVNEEVIASSNQLEQQPIIRIGSLDNMIVEAVISEYDTLKIKEGQTATLRSDALPDKTWKGTVSFVSFLPEDNNVGLNDTSGVQYPVKITIEEKNIELKPGFQMIVEIETNKENAETLPLTAVIQDGDTNYVYVVKDDGTVEKRDVKVGSVSNESIAIVEGINSKEQVVISPPDNLVNGMEVTVK